MTELISAIGYYQENEATLRDALDQLVEQAKPEDGDIDIPAITFATLVGVLNSDPGRAVTLAALAVMRLGEGTPEHAPSGLCHPGGEVRA